MAKRRDWHDIIAEILRTARDGKLKTHIMFRARLSYDQVNKYLSFLVDKGLMENLSVKKKKLSMELYHTTQKGLKLMEILELMKKLEGSFTEKYESRGIKLARTPKKENE